MAAPIGNRNARKGKEWFDALRKQCVQRGTLDKVAQVVCEKAEQGEPWAIQELANRFDGKPAQAVELSGPDGDPMEAVTRIELVPMRGNSAG
jgi:hypothetical protein